MEADPRAHRLSGWDALQLTGVWGILDTNRGGQRRVSLAYRRILVVRTDRLGDVLLTLPVFPCLRACFPGVHLSMLLRRYPGGIAEGNPHIDSLLYYDREEVTVPFPEMLKEIRNGGFDAAIVARPRWRIAWLLYRAGIPVRVGSGYRVYSPLFNRRVYEHRKDAARHELEYTLGLLSALGCPPPELPLTPDFGVRIPVDVEEDVASKLRSAPDGEKSVRVVLHPGSGGSAREWPVARFARLARILRDSFDCQLIVTGTAEERGKVEAVAGEIGGRAASFPGTLSLRQLAAVLRGASLVIANSTGPLHLAVAVGAPVLGLYPPQRAMSARRWGPYAKNARILVGTGPERCRKCAAGRPCVCMETIAVEDVFRTAKEMLAAEGVSGVEKSHEK